MDLLQERPHARQLYPAVLCIATVVEDHVYAGPGVHPPAITLIGDVTVQFLPGLEVATFETEKTGTTLEEPAAWCVSAKTTQAYSMRAAHTRGCFRQVAKCFGILRQRTPRRKQKEKGDVS